MPGRCEATAVSSVPIIACRNATANTVNARDGRKDKKRQEKKKRSHSKSSETSCSLDWVSCAVFLVAVREWTLTRALPCKQKDLSHLISHVFSQNIQEFLRPQACRQPRLKLNSKFKSHLGEQTHTSVPLQEETQERATVGENPCALAWAHGQVSNTWDLLN